MKLSILSPPAQEGLRLWSREMLKRELCAEDCRDWAWICQLMRASEDRAEYFPKGKWATIQYIENTLYGEAHNQLYGEQQT